MYARIIDGRVRSLPRNRSLQHLREHRIQRSAAGEIRHRRAGGHRSHAHVQQLERRTAESSARGLHPLRASVRQPRLRADAVLEGYVAGSDEQFVSQSRGREITFGKSLDLIERLWNRAPGRLLDIGTGGGSFPFMASQRGWKVEGCEPNRLAVRLGAEQLRAARSGRARSSTSNIRRRHSTWSPSGMCWNIRPIPGRRSARRTGC